MSVPSDRVNARTSSARVKNLLLLNTGFSCAEITLEFFSPFKATWPQHVGDSLIDCTCGIIEGCESLCLNGIITTSYCYLHLVTPVLDIGQGFMIDLYN